MENLNKQATVMIKMLYCPERGCSMIKSSIGAAQSLICKDFPSMGGLQQPVLQETSSFEVSKGEFVQILHVRGNHWCVVSYYVGCEENFVSVYDTFYSSVSKDTPCHCLNIIQLSHHYHCPNDEGWKTSQSLWLWSSHNSHCPWNLQWAQSRNCNIYSERAASPALGENMYILYTNRLF